MWDVKININSIRLNNFRLFYLNYVGCKDEDTKLESIKLSEFYLNYVGCKVFNTSLITSISYCFTLTMWDVKQI